MHRFSNVCLRFNVYAKTIQTQNSLLLKMGRFDTVDENQLKQIIDDKNAKNTKYQTKSMWNIFLTYIKQKSIDITVR